MNYRVTASNSWRFDQLMDSLGRESCRAPDVCERLTRGTGDGHRLCEFFLSFSDMLCRPRDPLQVRLSHTTHISRPANDSLSKERVRPVFRAESVSTWAGCSRQGRSDAPKGRVPRHSQPDSLASRWDSLACPALVTPDRRSDDLTLSFETPPAPFEGLPSVLASLCLTRAIKAHFKSFVKHILQIIYSATRRLGESSVCWCRVKARNQAVCTLETSADGAFLCCVARLHLPVGDQ